ncbi:MAG: META domain-containing protein [Novosphingobium sp.]
MLSMSLALAVVLGGCTTMPAAAPALAGSEWRFTAIDGAPPVGEATLSFAGDRLAAYAGCNRLGGTWRVEAGKLTASPLISTQMFCEGKMEQERAVAELLDANPDLAVDGDRMTLRSPAHTGELARMR